MADAISPPYKHGKGFLLVMGPFLTVYSMLACVRSIVMLGGIMALATDIKLVLVVIVSEGRNGDSCKGGARD